ncbi:cell division protein ZapE [Devosia pacifica]|uniref:Cell division protein ZapE n=1 Tax=Devosia pacifica TaxID=1335967 RepID=A0A918VUK9_9HYPH|nr:cell division protein ZapE [Devosia pacifica]GHA24484.1 cell division protein ZapE [Devosia pacifica]
MPEPDNSRTSNGPVTEAYESRVARGSLTADPAQREAALQLDAIAAQLAQRSEPASRLKRLFGAKRQPIRGAYIHGEVGRGKTMLMDLFFEQVAVSAKRRVHYHEFMDEMHTQIAAFRKQAKQTGDDTDPVAAVVKPLLRDVHLLCLDEFHVQDITNAMLLSRLFEKLFAGGLVLVATSNVAPRNLYENGLNRQLFLPFIDLLEQHASVLPLPAARDYRRDKFAGQDVFAFGDTDDARAHLDRLWERLTGGEQGEPTSIESLGRQIPVPLAAMGAARFDFSDLCEKPLGSRDYMRIAHGFDTIVVDGVPQFSRTNSNAAKRFILLVDTLYDRGIKLAARFSVPLDALSQDNNTAFEFERTVSRLMEMQSADYLATGQHRQPVERE